MRRSDRNFTKIPDGKLGIIALERMQRTWKNNRQLYHPVEI